VINARKFGFSYEEVHNFITRCNSKKRKLELGIANKPKVEPIKGRISLPPSIEQLSKLTRLQYELDKKEIYIKQLEVEIN